jgi:isoquinoline 1-oxidoreductase beta subunit
MPGGDRVLGATTVSTQINSYIRIGTDGTITLEFGGCEMGQGSKTGLPMILAEELNVNWNQIVVEQSLANPAVSYITGGSSAVSRNYTPLRTAGATVRELLVAAAMLITKNTTRANYTTAAGVVTYTNPITKAKTTYKYSALAVSAASAAATALLPATIPLTPPAQFKLIGTKAPRIDIPDKVNGKAQYGIDVWFPPAATSQGMVFAAIKHCPTIGGTLAAANFPATPAGAIAVVPCKASDNRGAVVAGTYNAVAVVATDTWTAKNLANQLRINWTLPANTDSVDSAALQTLATSLLTTGTPIIAEPVTTPATPVATIEGQVNTALAASAKTVQAIFNFPYLAHATMEPLNCTVRPTYGGTGGTTLTAIEVWAPTQAAVWVQQTVTAVTGLPAAQIIVHTTLLGGGLGRKIEQDYISQAVQTAVAVKKTVKLTWTREEDFGHDNYRPMAVVQAKAGLDATGKISAWYYRNVSPSILGQRGWIPPGALDSQGSEGATSLAYNLGTYVTEWLPLPSGIPVGFWRSVGNSINTTVIECVIDMLAKAAGQDPFTFRYNNINDARTLAVLKAADTMSVWRKTLPAGHYWGVAVSEAFGTVVAEVVEISNVTATSVTVNRVNCVVDCGQVINPDSVEAQMQGGILHALNSILWGQTTFVKGVAQQLNFRNYRVMRVREMPTITVQIVQSSNPPSGTGEPGVPPLGPALLNAYAAAPTGKRVYSLPLFPGATMGGL